jgi:2-dehydropantoate 2-reductase
MRLLVVGAGSTGGYIGGRLVQAGRDVTFLVRPGRAAQLRAHGLQIVSPHGDVTLVPQLVSAASLAPGFDAVLLTVKSFQLEAALADLAPAITPETMILPVLNGMRHMELLAQRFGARCLLGGTLKVSTTLDEAGRIVHLLGVQELAYGELDGALSARIQALDACLRDAGFDARLSPVIRREMWEKWVLLASLGGITCLMRGAVGEVEAAPGGTEFALRFFGEVVSVVNAVGEPPAADFLARAREILTTRGSPLTSSMYRDLKGGRPVEADQIIADLQRRARHAGIATPLLDAAGAHLAVYENARGRGTGSDQRG